MHCDLQNGTDSLERCFCNRLGSVASALGLSSWSVCFVFYCFEFSHAIKEERRYIGVPFFRFHLSFSGLGDDRKKKRQDYYGLLRRPLWENDTHQLMHEGVAILFV